MSHCYSVNIDGKEICTTHVPGNERLARDIGAGIKRVPTKDEIDRAYQFHLDEIKRRTTKMKDIW